MAVSIYIGGLRQTGNINTSAGRWLSEIAQEISDQSVKDSQRKINLPLLEQRLNHEIQQILIHAQKVIVPGIVGRATTSSSGTGETGISLNALRNYIGISPDTMARRNFLAGRAVFSNQNTWQRPWSLNADRATNLSWKNLAPSTLKKKAKRVPENRLKFFIHSGVMRDLITSTKPTPTKLVEVRGVAGTRDQWGYRDAKGRFATYVPDEVLIRQLRITILPGLPRSVASGLMRGAWDSNLRFERDILGLDNKTLRKLGGQSKHHPVRHLFQPVYSYYLRREVPRAIANAIQRAAI